MTAEQLTLDLQMVKPEEWRPVPGWPGYDVSDKGRVRSWRPPNGKGGLTLSPRMLNPKKQKTGYWSVWLCQGEGQRTGRCVDVHTIELEAFVGPCPPGMCCRHLNGDPSDTRLENLAWGTVAENAADREAHGRHKHGARHPNAKLTEEEAVLMIKLRKEGWVLRELSERFGISIAVAHKIVTGVAWKHL